MGEDLEQGTRKSWSDGSCWQAGQTSGRNLLGEHLSLRSFLIFRESWSFKTNVSKKFSVSAELTLYKETALSMNICSYGWSLLALKFYELVQNI